MRMTPQERHVIAEGILQDMESIVYYRLNSLFEMECLDDEDIQTLHRLTSVLAKFKIGG